MTRRGKKSLQLFGLMVNFLGLSAFYHNYFSGLFGSEETVFFSLAVVLGLVSPLPLLYAGWTYFSGSKKSPRGRKKRK